MAIASPDVIDWVKANGADILLEVIGHNDLKKCLTKRDVEGCLWTLVNVASHVLVVGKLPAVSKAIARVVGGITKFFEESAKGKRVLERYRALLDRLKKGPEAPGCPIAGPGPLSPFAFGSPAKSSANDIPKDCNLPPGMKKVPRLDLRAIKDIRATHFPGGSAVDETKGLFKDTITNTDLQTIFEKGLKDPGDWTENDHGYYEKSFSHTGVVSPPRT